MPSACRDKIWQDLDGVFLRPVVEDPAKEVHISIFDRLVGEEIVSHERHPIEESRGQMGQAFRGY